MIWTLPNILTIGRLLAAPGVALVFLAFDRPLAGWLALILFVAAGLTDFLDGWLARRFDQISAFGKMLDPIADKAMVIVALMVIVAQQPRAVPIADAWSFFVAPGYVAIPALIIVMRELLVSGLREFLGDIKLPVTRLAKWKTTLQMIAIGAFFAVEPLTATIAPSASSDIAAHADTRLSLTQSAMILLWIAAILTAFTGWHYFVKALPYLRGEEDR
ncbi:MAG: CDP-diacylglycerol--glycerol-3-phosphate 3-phosphatidyltransferase [Pseudomonadota bacterium]